jgi:4-amino-4-deoxy-L-arabinose transferase-like glycosyltransferase
VWWFALVAVLGAAVLSFNFGARHLITDDDTRFPVLARDALANGHWLLPVLPDGTPHLMKPPLQAWLIALASWSARSVTVRTAVLPSVLDAIGVVLVTCWLGRRLFGPDAGIVAGLTVATSAGIYQTAHSSMPDITQLVGGMGAMAVYVASARRPSGYATTDLAELRPVLAQVPLPLFSLDLQHLALSFNLDRPVVNEKSYTSNSRPLLGGARWPT